MLKKGSWSGMLRIYTAVGLVIRLDTDGSVHCVTLHTTRHSRAWLADIRIGVLETWSFKSCYISM